MLYLVMSDLHLGKGKFLRNGQLNILEDFFEDDRFEEFLEYYSSGKFYWTHVHLVLNGDILNLIQIDVEGVFTHIVDEDVASKATAQVVKGHPHFFEALKKFLASPNKQITYVIGNHDAALGFTKAQKVLHERVGSELKFCFELQVDGIHIEHGHRFEAINTVPTHKFFAPGPNGKSILNLPWGSLFCIHILPKLKKDRPLIDKVRPIAAYIKWTFVHDFPFFLRMSAFVLRYFVQTNMDIFTKQNRNFKTTVKVLKQITIYPRYGKMAKSILRKNLHIHTVVMGHTHVKEWRKFPEGRYYFNTGTWNQVPSMDAGLHEADTQLSYCMIDVHSKTSTLRSASLNVWNGKWRPFREEVST